MSAEKYIKFTPIVLLVFTLYSVACMFFNNVLYDAKLYEMTAVLMAVFLYGFMLYYSHKRKYCKYLKAPIYGLLALQLLNLLNSIYEIKYHLYFATFIISFSAVLFVVFLFKKFKKVKK